MSLLVVNEMTLSQSCVSVATPTYFPWEPNPIKSVIICPGEGEPTDHGAVRDQPNKTAPPGVVQSKYTSSAPAQVCSVYSQCVR